MKYTLLVLMILTVTVIAAQDTLILTDGKRMPVKVIELADDGYHVEINGRQAVILKGLVKEWVKPDNDSYAASNGIKYSVGDTIWLATGSGLDGDFIYANMLSEHLSRHYANSFYTIKKIKPEFGSLLKERLLFTLSRGIVNFKLDIEGAIQSCEIKDCKEEKSGTTIIQQINQDDKYDKLKKLKELLDAGILTQEEFDAEKKKILEGN